MRTIAQRPMLKEAVLALLVLGLVFLNFGHANRVFAAEGRIVVTTDAACGNPFVPVDGDHAPRHVCRIGAAADLPPPPVAVEPVVFLSVPAAYPPAPWHSFRSSQVPPPQPRGPPLFA